MKVQQNCMFAFEKTPKTQSYGVKATFRNTEGQQSVLAVKLCVYKYVSSTTLPSFCSLLKIEWKKILAFEYTPKTKSERPKTVFPNTGAFEIHFFFISDPIVGLYSNVNTRFHTIFHKKQIRYQIFNKFEVLQQLQPKL